MSNWFRRLEIALDFDSGFEIFLLLGRGELARPALERIAEQLDHTGPLCWHRLDRDGLDSLLFADPPTGALHLVHGFERMPAAAASDLAARLNVDRDRLEVLRGPVIFWIPEDFYEELLRQAPDFVAWRSQATPVPEADLGISPDLRAQEYLRCQALISTAGVVESMPALDVTDGGVRRPILEWLAEADLRSLSHDPRAGSEALAIWCAGQLARRPESNDARIPVLLPQLLLALANARDPELVEGIGQLWRTGALHLVVAAPMSAAERDRLIPTAAGHRLLVIVSDDPSGSASIAPLTDLQVRLCLDHALADLPTHERALWRPLLTRLVELLGEGRWRYAVLVAILRYALDLGLFSVQNGLENPAWREHTRHNGVGYDVDSVSPESAMPGFAVALEASLGVLARADAAALASSLYEFGCRTEGDAALMLVKASALLLADGDPATPQRVSVLEALARLQPDEATELGIWVEASDVARRLEPADPALLMQVLGGLGFVQHLNRVDEAEKTLREALALAASTEQAPIVLARLRELLASLEFATRELERRREVSPMLSVDLYFFARRLLKAGELGRALEAVTEAIELRAQQSGGIGFEGDEVAFYELVAAIHRAQGELPAVISAMDNAVLLARSLAEDEPLAACLITLAEDVDPIDPTRALAHLREAVALLERIPTPGRYASELAGALTRLGDAAQRSGQLELATSAYARVLVLAQPFPARDSAPVLAVERRLTAIYDAQHDGDLATEQKQLVEA